MRKRAKVTYSYDSISLIGEYNGKYHPNGNMVYFKTESGETLYWNTLLFTHRVSQVEKHVGEWIEITYTPLNKDESGRQYIGNVRFIRKKRGI